MNDRKNIPEMLCPKCKTEMKEFVPYYLCRNLDCRMKIKKYFVPKVSTNLYGRNIPGKVIELERIPFG